MLVVGNKRILLSIEALKFLRPIDSLTILTGYLIQICLGWVLIAIDRTFEYNRPRSTSQLLFNMVLVSASKQGEKQIKRLLLV